MILDILGAVRAHLLISSNRFTAYSFYAIELKLGRMTLDISPHNRSASDFSVSLPGGTVGARLLQFSNRFIAYNSHAIELNLGRMLLNISPHNRSESDFPTPSDCGLWMEISYRSSIHSNELKFGRNILDINLHDRYEQIF